MVNIGDSSSSINMYRDSVLAFPRSIPMGGKNLTNAIATQMTLTAEEAEARKKAEASVPGSGGQATQTFAAYNPFDANGEGAEGVEGEAPAPVPAPAPPSNMFGAMEPQLVDFVAEIRRSIDYYRSRGGDVESIGLTGGGSQLKGLPAYIEGSLGIPVQVLNPFAGLEVGVQPGAETYLQQDASEFSVAVGMGLHIAFD